VRTEGPAVSDRILLADRRPDAQYDLFGAQWADTDGLLRAVRRGQFVPTWRDDRAWTRCGRKRWRVFVDDLSYLNCDLCLRCVGMSTAAYLPVWAGIPARGTERTPATCGALVRVSAVSEYEHLRRDLRRHKDTLGVAIEHGAVEYETAQRRLLAACRHRERHLSGRARRLGRG